jgi:hypothetical protein
VSRPTKTRPRPAQASRPSEALDEIERERLARRCRERHRCRSDASHGVACGQGARRSAGARLALGELRRLARLVQAGLLALDLAGVAREEALALEETRSSGSASTRARAMPWRTAPAWPLTPPPCTRTRRSYWPSAPATLSGASATCGASRGEVLLERRPLIHVLPSPGRRITRATEVLRLPVPRYWRCRHYELNGFGACAACGCSGPA